MALRTVALSAMTGTGVSYVYNEINDKIGEDKQKEYNEVLESSINNTYNQLINEKEEWDDSNKIAIKFREYEDILHGTTLLANRHYRDTNNFVNVFGDNLRTFFFQYDHNGRLPN